MNTSPEIKLPNALLSSDFSRLGGTALRESPNVAQITLDGLLLEYLPSHSPEMNPLENCWWQLREDRVNRLFRTLDEVNEYLSTALPSLNSPRIYEYLC